VTYTELQVTSHFSFLRGASSCEELFAAAANLGYKTLGITDRNSVAGMVRALVAAETTDVRLVAGVPARPDGRRVAAGLAGGPRRLVRLMRLLTLGKGRANAQKGEKGKCFLHWEDVAGWSDGLVAALLPTRRTRRPPPRWPRPPTFSDPGSLCA
jgi:error-prone DNA polymerase